MGEKRARAASPVKRVVKHVVIALEGKENPRPAAEDVKGKGKEVVKRAKLDVPVGRVKVEEDEVDFDALFDGMDWEEEMVMSQEVKKVVVVSGQLQRRREELMPAAGPAQQEVPQVHGRGDRKSVV